MGLLKYLFYEKQLLKYIWPILYYVEENDEKMLI